MKTLWDFVRDRDSSVDAKDNLEHALKIASNYLPGSSVEVMERIGDVSGGKRSLVLYVKDLSGKAALVDADGMHHA